MIYRGHRYVALIGILAVIGLWQVGKGLYIYSKAIVAQQLIQHSWQSTLTGDPQVKPWPWADTWPVTRLIMPQHNVDVIVLAGDSGRTLAFGPGHRFGSATPGEVGNSVISAHRDTHFQFLNEVAIGEIFYLQDVKGVLKQYQIVNTQIVDSRNAVLPTSDQQAFITLVTCYPFDTIVPGGPMRYLVFASEVTKKLCHETVRNYFDGSVFTKRRARSIHACRSRSDSKPGSLT